MKLATWKRVVLGALMVLSVAGGSLAPVVAGHAAAAESPWDGDCVRVAGGLWRCYPK